MGSIILKIYKWIYQVKAKSLIMAACLFSPVAFSEVIYGVDAIPKYKNSSKLPAYVQLGNFKNKDYAQKLFYEVQHKHASKTVIKSTHQGYAVVAGPFQSIASLMNFYDKFQHSSSVTVEGAGLTHLKNYEAPQQYSSTQQASSSSHWYMSGSVGGQYSQLASSSSVNNGSGLVAPNDLDIYSANSNHASAILGLSLGKRYEVNRGWLTTASIGVQYQYFVGNKVTGEVTQFSLPQFKNYQYQWSMASNVLTANAKLNFKASSQLSPFVTLGIGGVKHCGGYTETASANVTPRVSPGFSSGSSLQFAYLVGAGIDYSLNQQLIFNAGYQFSQLGQAKSSDGQGSWQSEHLNFGNYYSNALVLGVMYLFDANQV